MLDPTETTSALNRNDFAPLYDGRASDLTSSPLGWPNSTYFHFVDPSCGGLFSSSQDLGLSGEQGSAQEQLHDELLSFCREQGIEDIAKHSGIIQNGEIPVLKNYSAGSYNADAASETGDKAKPKTKKRAKPKSTDDGQTNKKRRRNSTPKLSKKSKGLRHFSMKVCEKVESKRTTTYNEVADELVAEFKQADVASTQTDQKNIRRRVYDALNVLMAMGIISKEKKDIRWIGLPTNSKNTPQALEAEKEARSQRTARKREHLEELTSQHMSYTNLLARNARVEKEQMKSGLSQSGGGTDPQTASKIHLPFIIINTRSHTEIECEMAEDHSEYFFNFSLPFEIHDDCEILKRAGMDKMHGGNGTTPSPTAQAAQQQSLSASGGVASPTPIALLQTPETMPPNQIRNANI